MNRTLTSLAALFALIAAVRAGEIHDAVLKHDLPAVERLLKKDRSLVHAHTFPDYKTPLHYAVGIGDSAIVKRLLAADADINSRDAEGLTPLLRASVIVGEDFFQTLSSGLALRREESAQAFENELSGKPREALLKSIASVSADETRARLEILSALLAQKPAELKARADLAVLIHSTILPGSAAATKLILAAGADANAKDPDWRTPLHVAALRGANREVFDLLIAKGARTEAGTKTGTTPLMAAARGGFREAVEALIAHGAKMDAENNKSIPVIGYAAEAGHDEIVKLLHEKGGRALIRDARRDVLFQMAANGGSMALAQLLLAEGVDVNIRDEGGFTPLLTALEYGHKELVQFLIEKGADRVAKAKEGQNMFSLACQAGDVALVKKLIAAGADVKETHPGIAPLNEAIFHGRADVVELLIANGADVHTGAKPGVTPLAVALVSRSGKAKAGLAGEGVIYLASEGDYARIVEMLLAHGAKVDTKLEGGTTVMHLAAEHCGARVMKALIQAGGNPSQRLAGGGLTPLRVAAFLGRAETAKVLLDAGADPNEVNKFGDTLLHTAAGSGNVDMVRMLLDRKVAADVRNKANSATPLHYAAAANSFENVRLLLAAGANPNATDLTHANPIVASVGRKNAAEAFPETSKQSSVGVRMAAMTGDLKGRLKILHLLLEYGSVTTIYPATHASLLDFARDKGTPEIVELLQNPPPATKRARKP